MKKIFYWFMGDTAGRAMTAWWLWFWGKTISQGNTVTLEVAWESLVAMQDSVQALTESVSQVAAVYGQAQEKLYRHQMEYEKANEQAELALKEGNEEVARLAITRAITVEKVLPNLNQMVEQSQALLQDAKKELQAEREKLEGCRLEMENLRAIAEMNEALSEVMKVTGDLGIDSARSQFIKAETSIKNKNLQVTAQRELSQNSTEALARELDGLSQSDVIAKRLAAIRHRQANNLKELKDGVKNDPV